MMNEEIPFAANSEEYPMSRFTRIADALEEAGRQLQMELYDRPIPVDELRKLVTQLHPCMPESVLPSDHCYNRVNHGRPFPPGNDPMFLSLGGELYLFVGRNCRISEGPITHYPKDDHRQPKQVGKWVNGEARRG